MLQNSIYWVFCKVMLHLNLNEICFLIDITKQRLEGGTFQLLESCIGLARSRACKLYLLQSRRSPTLGCVRKPKRKGATWNLWIFEDFVKIKIAKMTYQFFLPTGCFVLLFLFFFPADCLFIYCKSICVVSGSKSPTIHMHSTAV